MDFIKRQTNLNAKQTMWQFFYRLQQTPALSTAPFVVKMMLNFVYDRKNHNYKAYCAKNKLH